MPDAPFVLACRLEEIPTMMPKRVLVDGRAILICRDGDEVFAVDEICPHKNESMAFGVVMNGRIICPAHQYEFELDTGRCNRRRCLPATTYAVEVRGDEVWVAPTPR